MYSQNLENKLVITFLRCLAHHVGKNPSFNVHFGRFWAESGGVQRLHKSPCQPQSVGNESLTHSWMRQGHSFAAHFESAPYDKHATLCWLFCENHIKTAIFISNRMAEIRESGRSSDFKSFYIGPKVSEMKVWPTIGCARVRVFQRTSN